MRLKYYRLQAVLSTGKFIYPILSSRGTQYEHSVCYTTLPLCQNWPEQFVSNFTNETEYYRLQAVLRTGKSIHPIPSSRGTLCMLYDSSTIPKLAPSIHFQFYKCD